MPQVRAVVHHAALPYREIGAFMAELRRHDDPSARALELAILTAVRPGEVLQARWDEFDLAERLWIVPPERMKAGKEHRVPLSDAALAVLGKQAAIRSNDYVFAGAYGADHVGRQPADAGAAASRADWPDCARVQIDVLRLVDREQTNFPSEVREMALTHKVSNAVEAAYRRSDLFEKRRQMMDAWARYCADDDAVVRFPARQSA